MLNTIKQVKTTCTFHFRDGSVYSLQSYSSGTRLMNYATSIKIKEKLYESNGKNIVGNIHSGSLSLELKSLDRLLINTNSNSQYYGYMDNTAYIDVNVVLPEENNAYVYMGRFYVESWENNTSSSEPYNVSIMAVDVLGKIKNINLGRMRLNRHIDVNSYLATVIDKLNTMIDTSMRLSYDSNSLNIFDGTSYSDWQLYFNNIDRTDIEKLFNNIAQDTISYIWIDRNRKVQTDCLLNDNTENPVCSLSGSTNLLEYGIQSGDIDTYDGVVVNYIESECFEDKQIGSINGFQLSSGVNDYEGFNLREDNILCINMVTVDCNSDSVVARCTGVKNYKKTMDLTIDASASTTADISVYGTIINYQMNSMSRFKTGRSTGEQITIDNYSLRKEMISTYVGGLIDLMEHKNKIIKAKGFINPKVRLGDMVAITGTRLGVSGNYKVTDLEFELNSTYRCTIKLLKTSENISGGNQNE